VSSPLRSCLYECRVFHRRLHPKQHEFLYRIFLFGVDLDELDRLSRAVPLLAINRSGLYSLRDADHFQMVPGGLRANAEAFLASQGITEKPARILLLTNARFLGYTFNPISIWFCSRADGGPLAAIAEVGNTFGELKPYLVPTEACGFHVRTPKQYYVSPYSELDLEFDFRFDVPGERLGVWIDDYKGEERVLVSSLAGERRPLTTATLARFTLKYPFITLKVIGLIHWQALRLWLKRIPFIRKEANPAQQTGVYRPHQSLAGQEDRPSGR
jgi:hypothetical protein